MIKLKFIPADVAVRKPKASIHKSGKLGFNKDAAIVMGLQRGKCFLIGLNDEDDSDTTLYLVECEEDDDNGAKVLKAGEYFYLNIANVFDKIGIKYGEEKVAYQVEEGDTYKGRPLYILKPKDEPQPR